MDENEECTCGKCLRAKIKELEEEVGSKDYTIAALCSECGRLENFNKQLEVGIKNRNKTIEDLRNSKEQLNGILRDAEARLADREERTIHFRTKAENRLERIERMQREIDRKAYRNDKLAAENADLRDELNGFAKPGAEKEYHIGADFSDSSVVVCVSEHSSGVVKILATKRFDVPLQKKKHWFMKEWEPVPNPFIADAVTSNTCAVRILEEEVRSLKEEVRNLKWLHTGVVGTHHG